jgi:hypothetical protein
MKIPASIDSDWIHSGPVQHHYTGARGSRGGDGQVARARVVGGWRGGGRRLGIDDEPLATGLGLTKALQFLFSWAFSNCSVRDSLHTSSTDQCTAPNYTIIQINLQIYGVQVCVADSTVVCVLQNAANSTNPWVDQV